MLQKQHQLKILLLKKDVGLCAERLDLSSKLTPDL